MTNKEFASFICYSSGYHYCTNQGEIDQILNWFVENFDEKDIEKVADILADVVKKSAATINDLHLVCIAIKKASPDFCDLWIIDDIKDMANRGVNAAKAGEELAKSIKKIRS